MLMAYRQVVGRYGEDLACELLSAQGYEIVQRNWRCARGEIDIVAREGDCWAFVEVKTRRGHRAEYPEDGLTHAKLRRLSELGEWYLAEAELGMVNWRIDLVAVELSEAGRPPRCDVIRGVGAY
jgi:putative endonuclease